MRKYIFYTISLLIAALAFTACSDMNDMHDEYLRDGEKTYIGRVDSIKVLSGNERVMIQYWVTDPRAKKLELLWNQKRNSVIVDIPEHEPSDMLEVVIGEGETTISEGDHTFFLYCHDNREHRSVVFEALVNVYGQSYQMSLSNRSIRKTSVSGKNLTIEWGGSSNEQEIGVSLFYTDLDGKNNTLFIEKENLKQPTILENINLQKSVQYQTLFLPQPNAIDVFKTDLTRMSIKERLNVALNKVAVSSDDLNADLTSKNAVDGKIENASRWVSDASNNEHWLEVDLGQSYAIDGFKTYVGSGGSFNYPIAQFEFQAWVDGAWETIVSVQGNSNAQYGRDFNAVTTNKVRYYVPAYSGNQIRLYELEVFSTIEY